MILDLSLLPITISNPGIEKSLFASIKHPIATTQASGFLRIALRIIFLDLISLVLVTVHVLII